MLDQEFVSCQEWKTINLYPILFFKTWASFINLGGYDTNIMPLCIQQSGHLFYENTAVGGVEIGISICNKEN